MARQILKVLFQAPSASLALALHSEQYYCTPKTVRGGRGITGWVNTSDWFGAGGGLFSFFLFVSFFLSSEDTVIYRF